MMMGITYFHRNKKKGISINKVTQTVISHIPDKEEYFAPTPGSSPVSILKNILFIFRHRNKKNINHITGDIVYGGLALLGCKSVLTYHDTTSVDMFYGSKLKKWYRELLWYRLPLKYATKVVCISEETKRCLSRFTSRKDILVIHNAIDPSITFNNREFKIKEQYNVLIIGTSVNKNVCRMVKSLKGLPLKLIIVGVVDDSLHEEIKRSGLLYDSFVGISDEKVNELYGEADLLFFCSLMEGFGMPVVEANKAGCPVICSDLNVLKEVAGDAAMYVDPYDIIKMHDQVKLLLENPQMRESLSKKGVNNAKRFEVGLILKQWIDMYKTL